MILQEKQITELMDRMKELEINSSRSNYYIDNIKVPRVTEILSAMISEPGLMNWSNGLGWKRISYRAFMKDAADKGTFSHLAIEKFLKNEYFDIEKEVASGLRDTVYSVLEGFKTWWNKIHSENKDIEIVYLEKTLLHPYFGGTCDCLLKVDGKYWLIDFKTSNHMSYNYALQLSAYRFLLKELKNIEVSKCIILKLSKTDYNYETYELDLENPEHLQFIENCYQTFVILTAAYRMRLYTTDQYYEIYNLKRY